MKYLQILCSLNLALLIQNLAYSQSVTSGQSNLDNSAVVQEIKPSHWGVQADLLNRELEQGLPLSSLKKKYHMYKQGLRSYIPAMVAISDGFDRKTLRDFEVQVNTDLGKILSLQIPIDHYRDFISSKGIEYIELSKKVYPKLDKALESCRVTQVHAGENLSQPYRGKDVVIGILDVGFDYTHPTFYDPETGALRIKKVWEQNISVSSSPIGYTYGQELASEQAILNEQIDLTNHSHGTHVAGVAAGSGGNLADLYRGVAPASDIVLVSLQVNEGIGGLNTGVIDGINYIFQYAESVGKPAVINLSQGHHIGPHDGTSLTDQAIDALSGPGRIIVGAVGNEGDASGFFLHFDHTFDQENTILNYLIWPDSLSSGTTTVDIWGEVGTEFELGIEIYNPLTKTREAVSESLQSNQPILLRSGTLVDLEGDTLYYEGGIEINPLNDRPHIQISINSTSQSKNNDVNFDNLLDNDFVQLRFQSSRGTVHAYAANNSGEAFFGDLTGIGADKFVDGIRVVGGTERSTMGELGGTAHSIISVGGYITKNSFVNVGNERVSTEDVIGAQYTGTSQGPTLDGRTKPDISAPAGLIAAPENSFYNQTDPQVTVDQIAKEDGSNWTFGIRGGTSSSAPLVAGIVALMLEVDPSLTPENARDILISHAVEDNFTGSVPNQIWGYGKVDAAAVMSSLDQPTSTQASLTSDQLKVFPNPNRGKFTLESDIGGDMEIKVLTPDGRTLFEDVRSGQKQWIIDLPDLANGVYFLHIRQKNQRMQRKLIILN